MLEEEEERLGRPLDDFEREQRLREIIDMKIEKVVLNLGISRSSVHFVENYKSVMDVDGKEVALEDLEEEDKDKFLQDKYNSLTINYRALRLLHECTQQAENFMQSNLKEKKRGLCTIM